MQLTCEAKFGEDGKEGAEHGHVPRAKWWQSLTQLQLPTFMETIAALQIGATKRGLCILWDKGEIQKRHGGCINIHVRIENMDGSVTTVPLVVLKDLWSGKGEYVAEFREEQLKRAEMKATKVRAKLQAKGEDTDSLAPINIISHGKEGGWLSAMQASQTDGCAAAKRLRNV